MSKNTTTYTVFTNDTAGESRSRKGKAIELAEQALAFDPTRTVEVRTNAGTVVWPEAPEADAPEADSPETEVTVSNRSKPGTRTEVPTFDVPKIPGYEVAYTRALIPAAIYRGEGGLLVVTVKDGKEVTREEAANTTEARVITNRLSEERRVRREAEKAAEAQTKLDAKTAKAAAKAKADQEKADAKAATLAAKEKAAADAEAEAPADAELVSTDA